MKSLLTGNSHTYIVNSEYIFQFSDASLLLIGRAVFSSDRRAQLSENGKHRLIGSREEVMLN
jgi:hypothetical protein